MKFLQRLASFAFFFFVFVSSTQAETAFWLKTWTVVKVESKPADRSTFDGVVGMKIVMDADRLVYPLGEDCENGVTYDDVLLRPVSDLGNHFGGFWKWPKFSTSTVAYGWVRCHGSNVGAFAFVGPSQAYLFYEDGSIVFLK